MHYQAIPELLASEGSEFQSIENRWRPGHLLFDAQARALLKDLQRRYDLLGSAQEELQTLDRADKYLQYLHRMRLWLRQASFRWKSDQLAFLQAVAGFYSDYGIVLRFLKFEQAKGRFDAHQSFHLKGA